MSTDNIRAACVMGWPVAHSRSPLIHGYWLKRHGVKGDYRREAVTAGDFPAFLKSLGERGYVGGNITQPHKEMALKLTEPDERARAIGAANTIWIDNGKLRSTNTDVIGFLSSLDVGGPGWDKNLMDAVVLGAGGAARAVVYGLVERGAERVHVVNRTIARAEVFSERFGPRVHPVGWDAMPRLIKDAGLIVNTTSLGMTGNPELPIDLSGVRDDAVIGEIIYVPLKTKLLQAAEKRGLRHSDGLDMLLYQAVRGFELWFGVKPTVTPELRQIIVDELTKKK
ncbi:MAG: shikimate dehydrogenase [Proteobacteria bacterium]|nr:shikimate dehydrogenase [Pseudomonadota bacterium]